jgi:hypothetical protein
MQKRILILLTIPLLMMGSALANAQTQPQLTQETPFTNLNGSTFQMYNQTSGSTSTIHFNPDGSYSRVLGDHNMTGTWTSNEIITQKLTLCPTATEDTDKWTDRCLTTILKNEGDYLLMTDHHDSTIHLAPSR